MNASVHKINHVHATVQSYRFFQFVPESSQCNNLLINCSCFFWLLISQAFRLLL